MSSNLVEDCGLHRADGQLIWSDWQVHQIAYVLSMSQNVAHIGFSPSHRLCGFQTGASRIDCEPIRIIKIDQVIQTMQ